MEAIKGLNLGVRFLLELCILVILGYWGFKTGGQTITKILLGIGSPILFAVVWGAFLAPKSSMRTRALAVSGRGCDFWTCNASFI